MPTDTPRGTPCVRPLTLIETPDAYGKAEPAEPTTRGCALELPVPVPVPVAVAVAVAEVEVALNLSTIARTLPFGAPSISIPSAGFLLTSLSEAGFLLTSLSEASLIRISI